MDMEVAFGIKTALFILIMPLIYYAAGWVFNYLLKLPRGAGRNIVVGFLFHISLFELTALPFMLVKGSFSVLMTWYLILLAVFYLYALILFAWLLIKKKIRFSHFDLRSRISFFSLAFMILLGVHIGGVTAHQITMGDDNYYVTLATYAIEQDTLETNTMFITTGLLSAADIRPNISAWEYYVATLSEVFQVHPAQMFHFLLPLLLIPLSYIVYREVIKELFERKKVAPYIMWYALLNLFFSFSNKLNSYNMFNCPWMGKVVLYNILMPAFLLFCIGIMKAKNHTLKYWMMILMIMCAGVCATVVGVYMIPLYYAVIGISYAVTIRSFEEFHKLLLPVLITIIPVAIVVILIFSTDIGQGILQYSKVQPKNWLSVFENYWGISQKPILGISGLVLFLVSTVVIFIRENKVVKIVLCGTTVLTAATLLNPLFIKQVSSYLTGADLYWRMYILLPVVYVLPYLFTEFSLHVKGKFHIPSIVLGIAVAVLGTSLHGSAFANKTIFQPYECTYGIPKDCVTVSDYLLERTAGDKEAPNVLYPMGLRRGLRQYTTKMNTLMGRNYYHNSIQTDYGTMQEISRCIFGKEYTNKKANKVLHSLNIDYVVMRRQYRNKKYFKLLKEINGYHIYEVK